MNNNNYKEKYLKYKKKYLSLKDTFISKGIDININPNYKKKYFDLCKSLSENNKKQLPLNNQIGGAIEYITIPEDALLFRGAPNIMTIETTAGRIANVRECGDTGKIGLYFGSKLIISLGMCIEYNKLMEIGIFKVTKDIENVSVEKYSFRDIHPERYVNPDGTVNITNPLLPDENLSHIGCNLNVLDNKNDYLLPSHIQDGLNCLQSCEIFLSTLNPEHLDSLELIGAYRFNPALIKSADDLHQYMIREHFPFDIKKYVDDGILIQFH